ncbi:MAG: hypothetical protein Kow00109_14490 [Acidobacteriota bacterium]
MRSCKFLFLNCLGFLFMGTALGFNPLAHMEIARRAFPDVSDALNRDYGAVAPDVALYVADLSRWPSAFEDTHYTFIDLRGYALSAAQRSFALGWLSHNEAWGADHVAHIEWNGQDGYVVDKAAILPGQENLSDELAHYAVEAAVDLLLKRSDRALGRRLLEATLYRSWQDRSLLTWILVWRNRRTDWWTLNSTELEFRYLLFLYAAALSQPEPRDLEALSLLAAQLGETWFGTTADPSEIAGILQAAMGLCANDYETALEAAVTSIRNNVP